VVIDTGVLVSAFVFGGVPEGAIKKAFREVEVWISPQLLEEYRETPFELEAEGKISHLQLRSLLSGIASFVVNAKVVTPKKRLSLCRDEEDNMILECCFAAEADFLITGDKDLLEMEKTRLKRELPKLKIVSPRTFLEHNK
jgi:putative PIN family toxin of toxin-antitoxin system